VQEGCGWLVWGGGSEKGWEEGEYSTNTISHVCKWKNNTVETIPGRGKGGMKKNGGKGEFQYDMFDIFAIYPHPA
jgi:hypothetical protein